MAPLTRILRPLLLAVGLVLAGGILLAQDTPEPDASPDAHEALDVEAALAEAEAAFLEADFETALEKARGVARSFEREDAQELADEEQRALLARALDLIGQSLYNLGNEAGMKGVMDRLVALEPGYRVDAETAGQRYVQRFDARRNELTGTIQVVCEPLPCESIRVGERELELDESGQARVLAGTLRLELRRHAFREQVVEDVEIQPGETKSLSVELVQIARDLVVRTRPAGVRVSLDGAEVGATEAADGQGDESAALVLLEVEPGVRSIAFEAPCLRRVERRIDVTLDRLDPSPIELGVVELEPVYSELEVEWSGPPATLVLDAGPIEPGTHRLCPGAHSLSVSVAGRRVWFEEFTLDDDEVRKIAPSPRPTIALEDRLAGRLGEARGSWNLVRLESAATNAIAKALGASLEASAPTFPSTRRAARPELAPVFRRLAPEADLVVLALDQRGAIGKSRRLVLISPEQGALETTLVSDQSEESRVLEEALSRDWEPYEPYVGLDLFARRDGSVVVAGVSEGSPAAAAGLVPGEVLLSLGGAEAPGLEQALAALRNAPEGQELVVSLEALDGERRDAILKPSRTLRAPFPEGLERPFLLPLLARADVWRAAGSPRERMAGSLLAGTTLAALGLDEAAARALDLAAVDESVDRAGDARGTITWLLEAALRRLGEPYADEVRTRLDAMGEARLGGREGPPLGWRPR